MKLFNRGINLFCFSPDHYLQECSYSVKNCAYCITLIFINFVFKQENKLMKILYGGHSKIAIKAVFGNSKS